MEHTYAFYHNLNEHYKARSGLNISNHSSIAASLKPMATFKSIEEIKLPFLISGRLVSADSYKDAKFGLVDLDEEELQSVLGQWIGINIYTSHAVYEKVMRGEDVSINEVVGKIINTSWNEVTNGIDFVAEIYDLQIAYKMFQGLIKYISVGFARDVIKGNNGRYKFINLEPKEASLVYDPRDAKAEFAPVEA